MWLRLKEWGIGLLYQFKQKWWAWLVAFVLAVIEERFGLYSRINRLVDSFEISADTIAKIKDVVSSLAYPLGFSFNLFVLTVLILVIHAYFDTRGKKLDPKIPQRLPINPPKPLVRASSPPTIATAPTPVKPPEPPQSFHLTIVRIIPILDKAGQALRVILENASDRPILIKLQIQQIRAWSIKQKTFVSFSTFPKNILFPLVTKLEPDMPLAASILHVVPYAKNSPIQRNILVAGPNDINPLIYPNMIARMQNKTPDDEIFLCILRIDSDDKYLSEELFVKWDGTQITLTTDPRK